MQNVPPGTYTFTFEVEAGALRDEFDIDLVLPDPCENAVVTPADLSDLSFTLTEASRTIEPLFTVEPDFCAVAGTNMVTFDPIAGVPISVDPETQILTIPQVTDSLDASNPAGIPLQTEF